MGTTIEANTIDIPSASQLAVISEIAGFLGYPALSANAEGRFRLTLDGRIALTLEPNPDGSSVLMMADLPQPEEMDEERLCRTALAYNLSAASFGTPSLGRSAPSHLTLSGSLASSSPPPGYALAGIQLFLESLALAEQALAGNTVADATEDNTPTPDVRRRELSTPPWIELRQRLADFLDLEDMEFDAEGFCPLQLGDGRLLLLRQRPVRALMALHLEIATLEGRSPEEILAAALEYNFQAAAEGEPILALDEENNVLFLVTVIPLADLAEAGVEATLSQFFRTASTCRDLTIDSENLELFQILLNSTATPEITPTMITSLRA